MAMAASAPTRAALPPSQILRYTAVGLVGLLALVAAIILAGRWFGHAIAMGGHTDDATVYEVVIGNDVVAAPANMIRFDQARRDGVAQRLDLYMRWPTMEGYSAANVADFNNQTPTRSLVFASFEPRIMSRDMTKRLEPIYMTLVQQPGRAGPGGSMVYDFKPQSGYANEQLFVFVRKNRETFVARCLVGAAAANSLAPCQRDMDVGQKLSLSYRFPAELLNIWPELDRAIREKTAQLVKTAS